MFLYPTPILAHRGGGTLAPENTLAGLKAGMARGYRATEFDVMLARDGVPVVMHDPSLGRTVAGRGMVSEVDAAALARMDAGSWFSARYAGEPVPLFVEFAGFCKAHGVWMNIELKPVPGCEEATGTTVARLAAAMFAQAPRADWPLLSSFSAQALAAARAVAPDLPRACLMDGLPPDWEARANAAGAVALHVNHRRLTEGQARAVKGAGYALFCYTVNDPARARVLRAWGVDAFCTDRLDLFPPD